MYRTLTNPKFLRRLPHRSLCFYNILCNLNRPFFDIIFQGKIPRTHCFYNVCGGLQLYCSCKLAHIKCCVFSLDTISRNLNSGGTNHTLEINRLDRHDIGRHTIKHRSARHPGASAHRPNDNDKGKQPPQQPDHHIYLRS